MSDDKPETHPVQLTNQLGQRVDAGRCPKVVTLLAYEVFCAVYGKQEAMVVGGCRGGFSTGELIAFLYARNFPRNEWSKRVDEAFRGMEKM